MKTNERTTGIGFAAALCLLFVHHQLRGDIDWPWWWLAAPIWIPMLALTVAVILLSVFRK